METTQNIEKDKWQIALDKELQEIKQCQQSKGFDSCMKCEEILQCKIKEAYLLAVYESMNKGSGGGFEF